MTHPIEIPGWLRAMVDPPSLLLLDGLRKLNDDDLLQQHSLIAKGWERLRLLEELNELFPSLINSLPEEDRKKLIPEAIRVQRELLNETHKGVLVVLKERMAKTKT
jgi:hypothetical protein